MKKWLAALLVLCLMLALVPAALAEGVSEAVDAPVFEVELELGAAEAQDADVEAQTPDAPAQAGAGWRQAGGYWYYYAGGRAVTGWQKIGGSWYCFNVAGRMLTGWQKIGGAWYYFASSGAMATGWQRIGASWYHFAPSGAMQTGWQKIGGFWYYFQAGGAMMTGWMRSGSSWYCFNASGAMMTGWQKIGGSWYYFTASGAMMTGWMRSGSKWYYFESSGAMVTGRRTIDGKQYTFDSNGVWLPSGISEAELRRLYQQRANRMEDMEELDSIKYLDVTGNGVIDAIALGHSDDGYDKIILEVYTYRNNTVECILTTVEYGMCGLCFYPGTKTIFFGGCGHGIEREYIYYLNGGRFVYFGGRFRESLDEGGDYDGEWYCQDGDGNEMSLNRYNQFRSNMLKGSRIEIPILY